MLEHATHHQPIGSHCTDAQRITRPSAPLHQARSASPSHPGAAAQARTHHRPIGTAAEHGRITSHRPAAQTHSAYLTISTLHQAARHYHRPSRPPLNTATETHSTPPPATPAPVPEHSTPALQHACTGAASRALAPLHTAHSASPIPAPLPQAARASPAAPAPLLEHAQRIIRPSNAAALSTHTRSPTHPGTAAQAPGTHHPPIACCEHTRITGHPGCGCTQRITSPRHRCRHATHPPTVGHRCTDAQRITNHRHRCTEHATHHQPRPRLHRHASASPAHPAPLRRCWRITSHRRLHRPHAHHQPISTAFTERNASPATQHRCTSTSASPGPPAPLHDTHNASQPSSTATQTHNALHQPLNTATDAASRNHPAPLHQARNRITSHSTPLPDAQRITGPSAPLHQTPRITASARCARNALTPAVNTAAQDTTHHRPPRRCTDAQRITGRSTPLRRTQRITSLSAAAQTHQRITRPSRLATAQSTQRITDHPGAAAQARSASPPSRRRCTGTQRITNRQRRCRSASASRPSSRAPGTQRISDHSTPLHRRAAHHRPSRQLLRHALSPTAPHRCWSTQRITRPLGATALTHNASPAIGATAPDAQRITGHPAPLRRRSASPAPLGTMLGTQRIAAASAPLLERATHHQPSAPLQQAARRITDRQRGCTGAHSASRQPSSAHCTEHAAHHRSAPLLGARSAPRYRRRCRRTGASPAIRCPLRRRNASPAIGAATQAHQRITSHRRRCAGTSASPAINALRRRTSAHHQPLDTAAQAHSASPAIDAAAGTQAHHQPSGTAAQTQRIPPAIRITASTQAHHPAHRRRCSSRDASPACPSCRCTGARNASPGPSAPCTRYWRITGHDAPLRRRTTHQPAIGAAAQAWRITGHRGAAAPADASPAIALPERRLLSADLRPPLH
ncbi:sialidase-like [Homarus americanus]|uniref:sialidase-like n=1 Tax=Homarus americanus TaxID=6706 RepID=UPI001C464922|nr:sialidase-like [Homarus americanus]